MADEPRKEKAFMDSVDAIQLRALIELLDRLQGGAGATGIFIYPRDCDGYATALESLLSSSVRTPEGERERKTADETAPCKLDYTGRWCLEHKTFAFVCRYESSRGLEGEQP